MDAVSPSVSFSMKLTADVPMFAVTPIGRVRSSLTQPASAPKQGDEGAPDAWIEFDASMAPALHWIEFRDVFGSRHRVLSHHVYHIGESTSQTRELMRRFERLREKEEESDEKEL